jgi:hypothetical protein
MSDAKNDLYLIAVMRRYFAVKEDLTRLKTALEEKRKAAGKAVGEFYHVRGDNEHAEDVLRTVVLKKEMDVLMGLAEGWARGEIIDLDASAD